MEQARLLSQSDEQTIDDDESEIEASDDTAENDKTSTYQTCWNILNLIQGVGTLGIPYAVSIGGWLSLPCIVLYGFMTKYTGQILIDSQYDDVEISKTFHGDEEGYKRIKTRRGFAKIGEFVFESYGCRIVSIVQIMHLFGACVLYLILLANLFKQELGHVIQSKYMMPFFAGCALVPTIFITNMRHVSWCSLASVLLLDVAFIAMIIDSLVHYKSWKMDEIPLANIRGMTIANSIVLFSFVAHPYLPRIENEMAHPESYSKASLFSFSVATFLKLVFGVTLAIHFGDNTRQKISQNLEDFVFRRTITVTLGAVGFCSFPMSLYVLVNIIQRSNFDFIKNVFPSINFNTSITMGEVVVTILLRISLIVLAAIVASLLPEFALLMAVLGSCTAVCLVLIFPAYFWRQLKKEETSTYTELIIIFFGILSGIAGLYHSIYALVLALRSTDFND